MGLGGGFLRKRLPAVAKHNTKSGVAASQESKVVVWTQNNPLKDNGAKGSHKVSWGVTLFTLSHLYENGF